MPILGLYFLIYIAFGLILLDSSSDHPIRDVLFWIVPLILWSTLLILILIATPLMALALKMQRPKEQSKKQPKKE